MREPLMEEYNRFFNDEEYDKETIESLIGKIVSNVLGNEDIGIDFEFNSNFHEIVLL